MINYEYLNAAADNLMVMTLLFITFTFLSNLTNLDADSPSRQTLTGLVCGVFACIGMLMPITITEGVIMDARVPIISMAGIFAGPAGAIIAGVTAIFMRLSIGGIGALTGVISILIPMIASGWLGHYIKTRNNGIVPFRWIVLYGIAISPICLGAFFMLPAEIASKMIIDAGFYLISINLIGALLLGYMLSQDLNRRTMTKELINLRQQAEDAADAKSVFMARMSHELRTPMNSIIGFTDLLRSTSINDEQLYFLEQIKVAGRTMTGIISDILDFSKMDVGKTTLKISPFNLAKLIEGCSALISPEAAAKQLELRTEIDPRCPEWVEGDELRLRQVLMNLLSNAIKFTSKGHVALRVVVNSHEQDQFVIALYVEDTGIGIPLDKQVSIFNAFEQADASLTRQHGGSGLGLSIAQQLTSMMGGRIHLKSAEGQGSAFCITIPLTSAKPVLTSHHKLPETTKNESGKTILVVEDIAMNRELVGSMLTKLGHQFATAENGAQAVEKLKTEHFDMVFMDLQMPVMNGYDATRAIREELNLDNDDLPIVALTAHALPEEIAKCFESGMDDFLTKPVEFIELASKVEEWLSGGTDGWDIVERDGSTYDNVPLLAEAELKSFISFIGADRLQEVYEDFVNDNSARLMLIRSKHEDTEMVRGTLHNMTSTSGNLGMKKLSLFTQHLLNQGVAKDRPAEEAELDLLDNIFRESCRTLERYLAA